MATVQATKTSLPPNDGSVLLFTWTLTGTDDGSPIDFAQWADRSVQMAGTWSGGTVIWQGSNNGGTTWFPLTDPQGNAITKTADALEQVTEVTMLARPVASVSVGSVVVAALVRRLQSMKP